MNASETRLRCVEGDALHVAAALGANAVNLVLTCPPYWPQGQAAGGSEALGRERELGDYIARLAGIVGSWAPCLAPKARVLVILGERREIPLGLPVLLGWKLRQQGWCWLGTIPWISHYLEMILVAAVTPIELPELPPVLTMERPQPHSVGACWERLPDAVVRLLVRLFSAPGETVLDPFGGSGTVARVSRSLGRHAIYGECDPDIYRATRVALEAG